MALNDDFKDIEENIKNLNDLGTETSAVFGDIGKSLSGLARDSKDFGSQISDAAKSQRSLAIDAQKLASFTKEDLKDKTKANNFAKIAAKIAGERAKIESQIRVLTIQRINASKAEGAILDKTPENLKNGVSYGSDIAQGFDEITNSNKELNNNTKFFDNLSETLSTIPGIGPAIAKPFAEAGKTARKTRVEGDGLMKSMGKGALEITKAFSPAIMLASLFEADKLTTDFAKQLGVSKDTAQEIKTSFIVIANSSGKAYLNVKIYD